MVGSSCDNWSMGEPPKLSRDNFIIWKNRMIAFLDCVDSNLLTTIREGPHAPAIPATCLDNEKVALEHKAKHIIVMSIPDDIYCFVISCETAKEIWDSLVVLFEGTDEVREQKGYLLARQHEVFTSKPGESITETYCRYSCLLNDLEQHSIVFEDEYVVETFLNSLPRQWSLISMVIRESKNFKTMSLQTLYGKLWSHEIRNEMTKLSVIQPCHGSECRKKQTENKVVVKDEGYLKLKAKYLKLKAKRDAENKRSTEVGKT